MLTAVEKKWRFPKFGDQRVLKLRVDAQQIFVNGEFSGGSSGFWDYTIYVNPYMVVRPEGHYTKHIYVNSERIASKIGNPEDYDGGDPTVQGQGHAVGRKIKMEEVVEENFNELFGSIPDIEAAADESLGMSEGGSGGEPNQYWFTSDHLGSSAFVTDASGVAIQHLEIDRREIREPPLKLQQGREQYMAFGEVFVDQRRTGFGTPYKFNAKELDCESGYYYYSARYYDPRMARFLSVDPLAGDMPAWSSYTYTFNNPLKYIDPSGMVAEEPPYGFDGLHWEDEDGVFTRDNINQNWTWTDSEGNSRGTYPSGTVPSGATQSVGFVDAAAQVSGGLLHETAKLFGLSNEEAAIAVSTVFIINDAKGLKVKKVIKNVDDLLDAAGKFTNPRKSGVKTRQGRNIIEGSRDDVFESLTDGLTQTSGSGYKSPNGRILHKHTSRKNGPTITIDEPGELQRKVRFTHE